MNVLYLISSSGLYGAENMVLQLAQAVQGMNCCPVIGVLRNAHQPNLEIADVAQRRGLQVEVIPCRGRLDFSTSAAIRACMLRHEIEVVHTHGYKANFYGYWATRTTYTPIVATCHNWPGQTTALRLYYIGDRLILRQFDHIAAVSQTLVSRLEKSGIKPQQISLIENAIDPTPFLSAQSLRIEHHETQKVIGVVGRLEKQKGFHFFLQAAHHILQSFPNTLFLIAGDGPERAALENQTRGLGIAENVVFLGQVTQMAEVYASMDIFALPSLNEGMPMVVIEAMAAGKPVVASRVGAIPEVVTEEETGLLVEPGNVPALQAAFQYLLENPTLCSKWGLQGRERVVNHFSSVQMGRKYLDVYSSVRSKKSSPQLSCSQLTKRIE